MIIFTLSLNDKVIKTFVKKEQVFNFISDYLNEECLIKSKRWSETNYVYNAIQSIIKLIEFKEFDLAFKLLNDLVYLTKASISIVLFKINETELEGHLLS